MNPKHFTTSITLIMLMLLTLVGIKWGAAITPDSCGYLSAAKSFSNTGLFMQYNNTILTNWPLLYPTLLSISNLIHINPLHWPYILNILIASLLVFYMSRKQLPMVVFVLVCCYLISIPALRFHITALTESLFISLLILYLLTLKQYTQHQTIKNMLIVSVVAGLSALLRYVGFYVCFGTAVALFFLYRNTKHTILFLLISLTPVVCNLLYNMTLNQEFAALSKTVEFKHAQTMWINITNYAKLNVAYVFISVLPLVINLIVLVKSNSRFNKILAIMGTVYLLAVLGSHPITFEEYLRYFIVYIPLVLLLDYPQLFNKNITYKMALFLFGLMVISSSAFIYQSYKNGSGGYNKNAWHNEKLKQYLSTLPTQTHIATNAADYLYFVNETSSQYLYGNEDLLATQLKTAHIVIWVDGIREDYMGALKKQIESAAINQQKNNRFTIYTLR